MSAKLRPPTCAEWNALVEITGGDNRVMHWEKMFSWCQDKDPDSVASRFVRGYLSATYRNSLYAAGQYLNAGFRPVFGFPDTGCGTSDGAIVTVGTLYMSGCPVKIPENPTSGGDISNYIPGARLEMRYALVDPAYQVSAIRVGNICIADRVLLKNINWADCYE